MATQFGPYVCIGDTVEIEKHGLTFRIRLEYDADTRPTDFDCYEQAEIDAWENDEWFFGGLVCSVYLGGFELDDHAAILRGIDCNYPGSDNSYLNEVARELVDEALASVRPTIDRLANAIAEANKALDAMGAD